MYPPIYTDILAALMHKKLFYIMQFIYSRINICNQHQDCYQSKRRNSLIDQYATNKRSDDIPHIHDVGNITIDESDIFMSLSEDYRLENRAKDALKDITKSNQRYDDPHIVDEECSCKT